MWAPDPLEQTGNKGGRPQGFPPYGNCRSSCGFVLVTTAASETVAFTFAQAQIAFVTSGAVPLADVPIADDLLNPRGPNAGRLVTRDDIRSFVAVAALLIGMGGMGLFFSDNFNARATTMETHIAARMERLEAGLGDLREHMRGVDQRFDRIDERLDRIDERFVRSDTES